MFVRDGFPTDRVELTAACEQGRAALAPADSPQGRFVQYFGVLFARVDQRHFAEQLAELVEKGAATITVHPRGATETARALVILKNAKALEIFSHDLPSQILGQAVATPERPWIRNCWVGITRQAVYIRSRLFEGASN